jgi:heptaprenyl diphosphate synthase
MTPRGGSTVRLVMVSMLSAGGLVLFVFESFLPVLPWFRPGLGNIATILALLMLGFGDSLKVTVLRVTLGSLVLGRLFTPVFVLAISGGLASTIVMAAVQRAGRRVFGPVGISVAGAVAHNIVQIALAYLIFVKSVELFIFIPIFMLTGIGTGILTGLVSALVLDRFGTRVSGLADSGKHPGYGEHERG